MLGWLRELVRGPTVQSELERSTRDMSLMPFEAPPPPPVPPKGFRFGSEPPSMNDLVHLDNDHPYVNAGRGDEIERFKRYGDQQPVDVGRIIGRMGSRDVRARHVGPHPHTPVEGYPGLYVEWNKEGVRWEACQNVFRQPSGRLTVTR